MEIFFHALGIKCQAENSLFETCYVTIRQPVVDRPNFDETQRYIKKLVNTIQLSHVIFLYLNHLS